MTERAPTSAPRAFAVAWRVAAAVVVVAAAGALLWSAVGREPPADVAMARVAAGPFFMGCAEDVDRECSAGERPGRMVDVDAFLIDRHEVTVADYARCVAAGVCASGLLNRPSRTDFNPYCNWGRAGRERHPINCVDAAEAAAYCAWAGKRLPTEVEWEKAARGTDRRIFPWGNAADAIGGELANLHQGGVPAPDRFSDTAPVGSFPAGAAPSGALDMCGNVLEWTADGDGDRQALRGGSWMTHPRHARVSFRAWFPRTYRDALIGIRCAR